MTQKIGQLEAGAEIKLVQTTAKAAEIELNLWRKSKGFGRIWYHSFSKNITDAVFEKSFISNNPLLEIVESKEDPNTGLVWQKVKMNVWVENAEFTQDLTNFWRTPKIPIKQNAACAINNVILKCMMQTNGLQYLTEWSVLPIWTKLPRKRCFATCR